MPSMCWHWKTLREVIAEMEARCRPHRISVRLREVPLPAECICESNSIRFNEVLLEDLLTRATRSESYCASCSELAGTEAYCRTVEREGQTYEEIPEEFIWEAACRAAGCDLRKDKGHTA
jgi:Domain of unknown function (DUF2703)